MSKKESWPSDPRTPRLRLDRDRHGKPRCYYRNLDLPGSTQVRLRAAFGTDAFVAEYQAAEASVLAGTATKVQRVEKVARGGDKPDAVRIKAGDQVSLNYMLALYYDSTEFRNGLGVTTRQQRRSILDKMCARVVDGRALGERRYAKLEKGHVMDLRDDLKDTPTMGNELVKALRMAYEHALARKMPGLIGNPCDGVKRLAITTGRGSEGFPTWTIDDVEKFEAHHPVGTRERLWEAVLLYTGVRRSDAILLNDDMTFDGIDEGGKRCRFLSFEPFKNRELKKRQGKDPVRVTIPILPELQRSLDETPRPKGEKHWILSPYGRPYKWPNSFAKAIRTACDRLGLPECSAHGLRKAGASFAAANGATTAQLMAIYGWESVKQAEHYIAKFARQRAASLSMHLVAKPPRPLRRKNNAA